MSGTARDELSRYGAVHAYPPFLAEGRGACATYKRPDDFTEDGTRTAEEHNARLRAVFVCLGCPFKAACRQWAVDTDQQGVWGATTTEERRELRRVGWR